MEFLTSTILSGFVWDKMKDLKNITGDYIKEKLQDYIVDEEMCNKIAIRLNCIEEPYKKTEKFLQCAVEEDQVLCSLLRQIEKKTSDSHDIIGSTISGENLINGNNNNITTNNFYGNHQYNEKKQDNSKATFGREELRKELIYILEENNQIFRMYGPTLKNKQDIVSEKSTIWKNMSRDVIVPNNKKIIKLLEENKSCLTQEEMEIFIKFKIHAQGFEKNQNSDIKISEYIQFPNEIYSILN